MPSGRFGNLFEGVYGGRKVFLTGHTGFKGSWMSLWLQMLGAEITGFSLSYPSRPNHFSLLDLNFKSLFGDIRNGPALTEALAQCRPDIVFHFAAQPIVRASYENPVETYETNLLGTVNLLEGCRKTPGIRAVIIVTTDKCYENRETMRGYREDDPMGGYDPYSASKACAELAVSSYRRSFFSGGPLVASVRAGNVIGGGDWGRDRLVPDIMRAAGNNEKVTIRNAAAVRPWQHVLDPLAGYLQLGQKLFAGKRDFAQAWNFGPEQEDCTDVLNMVNSIRENWGKVQYQAISNPQGLHEANMLRLDCAKANNLLGWRGVWRTRVMIEKTVQWYRAFYETGKAVSREQLLAYLDDAENSGMAWAA